MDGDATFSVIAYLADAPPAQVVHESQPDIWVMLANTVCAWSCIEEILTAQNVRVSATNNFFFILPLLFHFRDLSSASQCCITLTANRVGIARKPQLLLFSF